MSLRRVLSVRLVQNIGQANSPTAEKLIRIVVQEEAYFVKPRLGLIWSSDYAAEWPPKSGV